MLKIISFALSLILSYSLPAMMKALNTAATGMATQETHVNTISHNISNVNTVGYKKQRAESEDLLYETIHEAGARSSDNTRYNVGLQIGSGSKVSGVRKEFSQGDPQVTNNPYDLMINGEGFFGIELPNGQVRFTRDGAFNVDNQGVMVTRSGYKVVPNIVLPPNTASLNISESGNVEAFVRNQVEPIELGQIPVFTFTNPVGLKNQGGNLLAATQSSGEPMQNIPGKNKAGVIQQGSLESSNVDIMNEMTGLIKAQRAYEMNSKVMGVSDQMLQTVNNIR